MRQHRLRKVILLDNLQLSKSPLGVLQCWHYKARHAPCMHAQAGATCPVAALYSHL